MRHEHRLTVRSYECDSNGHVNNAVYLNYLEAARTAFLRDAGISYREIQESGYGLMVIRICIEYRNEARADDPLLIVTESVRKRLTGGTFRQRVFREQPLSPAEPLLLADAEVQWVCVNRSRKPARLPPFLDLPSLTP